MNIRVNPLTGLPEYLPEPEVKVYGRGGGIMGGGGGSGSPSAFITETTDGITTLRMHASDGSLWDMTVNAAGAWDSAAVSVTGGTFDFIDGSGFDFIDGSSFDFVT